MGEFLVPLRTLADLEDAKRAARVINDHSLAKMVTRKRKIRKSRNTIFLSVLSRNKFEDTSSSPSCNLRATSAEDTQCSEIQLLVRSSSRSPLCLQLHPSTTISALKGLLQEKLSIEPEKQHLFTKRHHELRNELSLKDHGIVQDSKIDLRLVSDLMDGSDQHKSAGKQKRRRKRKSGCKSSSEEGKDKKPTLGNKDAVNSNHSEGASTYSTSGEEISNPSKATEDRRLQTSACGEEQDSSGESGCSTTSTAKHAKRRTRRRRGKARGKSLSAQTTSRDEDKAEAGDCPTSSGVEAASNQSKSGRIRKRRRKAAEKSPSNEEANDNTATGDEEYDISDVLRNSPVSQSPTAISNGKSKACYVVPKNQAPGQMEYCKDSLQQEKQQGTDGGKDISQEDTETSPEQQRLTDEQDSPQPEICEVTAVKGKDSQLTSQEKERHVREHTDACQKENGETVKNSDESFKQATALSSEKEKHGEEQTCDPDGPQKEQCAVVREHICQQEMTTWSKQQRSAKDTLEQVGDLKRSETKKEQTCLQEKRSPPVRETQKQKQVNHTNRLSKEDMHVPSGKTKTRRERTGAQKKPACKENKERQIQLFVNSTSMGPICLQMGPATLITILKRKLQNQSGVDPEKQHHFTRRHDKPHDEQDANIEIHLVSWLMGRAAGERKSAGRTQKTRMTKKMRRKTREGRRRAAKKSPSVNADTCLHEEDKVNSKDSSISSSIDVAATEQSKSECHVVPQNQAPGKMENCKDSLQQKKQQGTDDGRETNQQEMETSRQQQRLTDEQDSPQPAERCEATGVKDPQLTSQEKERYGTVEDHAEYLHKENKEMVKNSDHSFKQVKVLLPEKENHGEEQTCDPDGPQKENQQGAMVREQICQQVMTTSSKQHRSDEDPLEKVGDLRRSETKREERCLQEKRALPWQEARKQKQTNHQDRPSKEMLQVPSGRTRTRRERGNAARKPLCEEKVERPIQLFVNSSLMGPICLQMHPSTLTSALKGELQDQLGIQTEKQHLFVRQHHELHDGIPLGDQAIEQDANIELRLVSGLMGGADDDQKSAVYMYLIFMFISSFIFMLIIGLLINWITGQLQSGTILDVVNRGNSQKPRTDPENTAVQSEQKISDDSTTTSTFGASTSSVVETVQDLVPSALHPAMQHPCTVCTHRPPGALQPAVGVGEIGKLDGIANPIIVGSDHVNYNVNYNVQGAAASKVV